MSNWSAIEGHTNKWHVYATEEARLSVNATAVALHLLRHADWKTGVCWVSQTTISKRMEGRAGADTVSRGLVIRAIRELEEKKLLRKEEQLKLGNWRYRLVLPSAPDTHVDESGNDDDGPAFVF